MHGTAKAEGSGPKKRRRWGDGILVGLQGVARGRWGTFATDWPMRERGRTPLHTTDRSSLRPSPMALLLAAVTFFLMVVVAWAPAAHAIPFQLRGGTISRTITVGHAVDSVLLEDVLITDGMPVVFDVAAMLPGALQINLKDCVCEGGSQIYVLGYKGEPSKDQTLEVNVSGLDGRFCSLVLAYNLPAQTSVTIRDSTITATGVVNYKQIDGLTNAITMPLVTIRYCFLWRILLIHYCSSYRMLYLLAVLFSFVFLMVVVSEFFFESVRQEWYHLTILWTDITMPSSLFISFYGKASSVSASFFFFSGTRPTHHHPQPPRAGGDLKALAALSFRE